MPLHDWRDSSAWEDVHAFWVTELCRWLRPRLPEGYTPTLSPLPALSVDAGPTRPDVSVRRRPQAPVPQAVELPGPDDEVAVAALEPPRQVTVTRDGMVVAVIELVSPRDKDRPEASDACRLRYTGYLLHGVSLLLVDVHPRPAGFSFPDALAAALGQTAPPCPAPCAVAFRPGEPTSPGRFLATWRRPLAVGAALPVMPLPLTVRVSAAVDLESTYVRAASDAGLE